MALSKECPLDIDQKEHSFILMKSLDLMRKEKQGCDLTIKVDDEEIQVHRVVMSAMSDYFKAMFAHDTLENRSGVVEMKGVGFKFVTKGVEYIYGGKVSISEVDCEEFLVLATMMQLPSLCEKIERFLVLRLNPTKFFEFKRIAEKFSCKILKKACFEYASENLGAISREGEFKDLEMEYLLSLIQCQASPYSEDSKCSVVFKWIKCDVKNRKCHLITLLNALNLAKLSHNYGSYLAKEEPLCFESLDCMRSMYLAAVSQVGVEGTPVLVPYSERNNALVMFDQTSKALQSYFPADNTWRKMHDLHADLLQSNEYAVVLHEKFVYIVLATKKFLRLNIMEVDSTWEQLENMLFEHGKRLRATVLDDNIYVVGKRSMERYSLDTKDWAGIDTTGRILDECALISYDNSILPIGGRRALWQEKNEMQSFTPASNSWAEKAPLDESSKRMSVTVHNDKIFIAGGQHTESFTSMQKPHFATYDRESRCWTKMAPMNESRSDFSLCAVGNKLIAVGGCSPQTMEMYDFDKKKWETPVPLPGVRINAPATFAMWLPHLVD